MGGGCCWLLYSSDLISSVPRVKSERDLIFDFVQMKIIYSYSKVILKKQKLVAVILPFPLHNIPFLLVIIVLFNGLTLSLHVNAHKKVGGSVMAKRQKWGGRLPCKVFVAGPGGRLVFTWRPRSCYSVYVCVCVYVHVFIQCAYVFVVSVLCVSLFV